MKTTVLVHMWNGVVNEVTAVGDENIEVIVLNQDTEGEDPLSDEGATFVFKGVSQDRKNELLTQITNTVEKLLKEDAEKFDELETEE